MFAFNLFLSIHCKNVPIWKLVEIENLGFSFILMLAEQQYFSFILFKELFYCSNQFPLIAYNRLLFQNSIIYYFSKKNKYRLKYFKNKINAKFTVTIGLFTPQKMGVRTITLSHTFSFHLFIFATIILTIWTLGFFYSLLHKKHF